MLGEKLWVLKKTFSERHLILECGLCLDNRVFILLVSKQTNTILTNRNRDEKTNVRSKFLLIINFILVSILIG